MPFPLGDEAQSDRLFHVLLSNAERKTCVKGAGEGHVKKPTVEILSPWRSQHKWEAGDGTLVDEPRRREQSLSFERDPGPTLS